jgi:hypothetical protein
MGDSNRTRGGDRHVQLENHRLPGTRDAVGRLQTIRQFCDAHKGTTSSDIYIHTNKRCGFYPYTIPHTDTCPYARHRSRSDAASDDYAGQYCNIHPAPLAVIGVYETERCAEGSHIPDLDTNFHSR